MAGDLDALIGRLTAAQKRALLWLPETWGHVRFPVGWDGSNPPRTDVLLRLRSMGLVELWRPINPTADQLAFSLSRKGDQVRARLAAMEGGHG